jgi:hypothetical protein
MAIYSSVPPPEQAAAVAAHGVHVALHSLSLAEDEHLGGVQLSIPLDGAIKAGMKKERVAHKRDSMKRRDALLKGKEGSRRRQRWENGELAPSFPPALQLGMSLGMGKRWRNA